VHRRRVEGRDQPDARKSRLARRTRALRQAACTASVVAGPTEASSGAGRPTPRAAMRVETASTAFALVRRATRIARARAALVQGRRSEAGAAR